MRSLPISFRWQPTIGETGSTHLKKPGDIGQETLALEFCLSTLHFAMFCAMSVVVVEKYNILNLLKSIVRHRITHLIIVPPVAVDFCKQPVVGNYDLSSVRYVLIGGGRILPGVEARVIKADGSLASCGESGELVVRGPSAALGYLNDTKATKGTFVNGWIHTGDQVIISETNEIFVIDRIKELLKVKGFQVSPAELEGCLLSHPDILDCCVVGVPDDYSGDLPLAYVTLTSDAHQRSAISLEAENAIRRSIMKHIADRMVSYKQLKGGVD
ncbi:hypothetical protein DXG03_007439 [Asterophora parasitica]|uniref:AMP-binding enzyme C-terminal domain-containing protein n=1 Tax=Asterophora parasitica TaxID=117018 RepID=A0A9P7GCW8_9AGAR|nr:hypothetical protein DXG03_007439 [Asterophora parasitica]